MKITNCIAYLDHRLPTPDAGKPLLQLHERAIWWDTKRGYRFRVDATKGFNHAVSKFADGILFLDLPTCNGRDL